GLGHDSAPAEHEADPGRGGREADVHGQGHGGAEAHRGAIDGGDDRLLHVEDAEGEEPATVPVRPARLFLPPGGPLGGPRRRIEGPGARGEIGPGAEGAPRPRHDDHADGVIRVGLLEGLQQLAQHDPREGIELGGAIEGDGEDAVLHLVADLLEGHQAPERSVPPGSPEPASSSSAALSLRNTVLGSMPSSLAVSVLLPRVMRSVSSSMRCSTSASGVPTRMRSIPSPPPSPAVSPGAGRSSTMAFSVILSGRSPTSTVLPRASTTARSTTFSSS